MGECVCVQRRVCVSLCMYVCVCVCMCLCVCFDEREREGDFFYFSVALSLLPLSLSPTPSPTPTASPSPPTTAAAHPPHLSAAPLLTYDVIVPPPPFLPASRFIVFTIHTHTCVSAPVSALAAPPERWQRPSLPGPDCLSQRAALASLSSSAHFRGGPDPRSLAARRPLPPPAARSRRQRARACASAGRRRQ